MKPFVHLHVHTEFSLLDGCARINKLNAKCREMNMPAIAITDHGNMYGAITFYDTITQRKLDFKSKLKGELKPIIGCEFYLCENMYDKTGGMKELNHLVLLAKNEIGYKNLLKLNSEAFVDGFYYKPRIDLKLLEKHTKGLICLSACLAGVIPRKLLANDYQAAKEHALYMKSIFEEGDFYIELQDHGLEEQQKTNPLLYKIAKEIGVKPVATNDVHYIDKEDNEMQDVLMCVQMGKTYESEDRLRFTGSEFYLKSGDEMAELFSWCPEAVENTLEIADKCNVTIKFKQALLPPYQPDDGSNPDEFLRNLTYEGLERRYGKITDEIRERAEFELNIIISMGFTEYYLIVWDFINYAHENNIPVGAGRGSGVGSIVAYAIAITNVDPLKYSLLFERFLNPERVSNPDFDIDFCYEGRGQVIDYVIAKYGASKVAQIITFGTLAAKAAIKDVARVYAMPLNEVDRITKLIPTLNANLKAIIGLDKKREKEKISEIIELYNNDPSVKSVIDMAIKLEGMPRNCSTHAAGVVISRDPVSDHVPLQRNGEDITTQYDKDQIEDLGLLKMDFLGLRTLTDIKYAKQYVRENTGKEIDFQQLGYEDQEIYKMIGTGSTDAVFQLESAGMKSFMKQLKPANFEDIIAGISLYRPGPMDSIPSFIKGKHNPENIQYDHEKLKPILEVTYGCVVYQEQVMQIVRDLAGYSYGRADILRRAMSKKKKAAMLKEKQIFIHGCESSKDQPAVEGAIARGVPEDIAEKIFDGMESFASYAFNKSHAAAYAVLSYETAYLKHYYPAEFITAVINNRINNAKDVSKYIMHAREIGIEVLPPDINQSSVKFSCNGESIRFGLCAIKNVGESPVEKIVAERNKNGNFTSLQNFVERIDSLIINKRMLECMILGGVFDCFEETRATLMASYESILNTVNQDKRMKESGQLSLFEMVGEEDVKVPNKLTYVSEYKMREKLIKEKEVLGIYITGHPLEEYRSLYNQLSFNTSMIDSAKSEDEEDTRWLDELDNKPVKAGGLLLEVKRHMDRNGRDMAICLVEDLYSTIEVVMFNSAYHKYRSNLIEDSIVLFEGKLSTRRGSVSIMADSAQLWTKVNSAPATQDKEQVLCIRLIDESKSCELYDILNSYKGETPVRVQLNDKLYKLDCRVSIVNAMIFELSSLLGQENVRVVDRR